MLCQYGQAIKAQDIMVVINPTSGCKEGGFVNATITANFVPSGHYCSWAINLTGFSLPFHDRTFSHSLTTGVYLFRCKYGSNIYSSSLINVTTYGTIEEICGEYKQWPYWVAGNYITTCEDGAVIIEDDEPGELYLKASNAITLLPGFTANTGTIVEARIAPVCSPNTESNVFSNLRESVLNSYINETFNTSIYPNPSSGDFMLDLNFPESRNVDIEVSDVTGKEVYKNKLGFIDMASLNIDLSREKPGLYLLKIISDSNTEFQKIVISR
ncbi:hypothetical protein MYP_248 [Sporocytophaga myxococcoides]|uniref:Secretion system C-terminal sorting domain-containing protein n=1 Tax=Sporocytophaga myxococcoides TaxID=153721 RepID=A0A098L8W7_9BACT|nr:hypothetical protein MYP_248 [Sporocytophaga myxococcoides]